jgi:hypothetical protein
MSSGMESGEISSRYIGGYGGQSLRRNQSAILGGDYAVKPSLLTDFRIGFFRLRVLTQKYDNSDLRPSSACRD